MSLIDLCTTRNFNLYFDVLTALDWSDPAFVPHAPATYAVTCRCRNIEQLSRLESWAYPLIVGERLPQLPIWLSDETSVILDLEQGYEETCRALRIP